MQKADKKREDILDAAMICLTRYGPVKATMDDIARILGLKKASLYYYYENKEAIFRDTLERELINFQDQVKKTIKNISTARDKIIALVKTGHDYFKTRTDLLDYDRQVMLDNHWLIKKLSKEQVTKNMDLMAQLIREGIDKGEFREADENKISHALRLIIMTMKMEMYQNLGGRRPTDKEFNELKKDSLYILGIFLDGLQKV